MEIHKPAQEEKRLTALRPQEPNQEEIQIPLTFWNFCAGEKLKDHWGSRTGKQNEAQEVTGLSQGHTGSSN